jgi:hypothetical protein
MRVIASFDFRAAQNHTARIKLPTVYRSLQRPNAQAFAEYLSSQTTKSVIIDHRGLPMSEVTEVDRKRVNAAGTRLIRALYFVETGYILPANATIKIAAKVGIHPYDEGAQTFATVFSKCPDHRNREIGNGFSYVAGFAPIASVWLLLLYEYFVWIATVQVNGTAIPSSVGQ